MKISPEAETLAGWYAAVAIEPALVDLEFAVRSLKMDPDDPRYWPEYSAWKKRMSQLVGWDAVKPELKRQQVFDSCFDYLLACYEGRA